MKTVDARGFSCPEPVLMTRNALSGNPSEVAVWTDTEVSKENVSRFLRDRGYDVEFSEKEDYFEILAKK